MQSRKDLRKRNNRNNLFLIIGGLIIVLAIICGVIVHNNHVASQAKARKFAVTHFNPNVTIYGVKVGNLTVNKATDKINQKADNTVHLKNKKIILSTFGINEEDLILFSTVLKTGKEEVLDKIETMI